ncbi:MAG: hypothetical protein DWI58_12485 [Chloroflexi bacterium]|nr:MAG: hypothetical protein DWI58_12485 [Chloroflexota bacterium]
MYRIRWAAAATLLVATLVLAGCSSDEATPEATPAKAATTAASTAAAATAAAKAPAVAEGNVRAVINDFTLPSPTVKVGGVIEFVNQDTTSHTATSVDKTTFDSKTIDGRGGTFKFTTTKAGTIAYACMIHPTMTGTITVQ